jgi:Holliday junction resolvase RusA-like endonuclease
MTAIEFFVAGIPKAMSVGKSISFRRGAGPVQHFQKRANTEWAVLVGQIGRGQAPERPWVGPVVLTARFRLPLPGSMPKKHRASAMPVTRPDLDNCFHKLMDQWNGVFWRDDSQVVDVVLSKRYAIDGRPGVLIRVERVLTLEPQPELVTTR